MSDRPTPSAKTRVASTAPRKIAVSRSAADRNALARAGTVRSRSDASCCAIAWYWSALACIELVN
jgi:hypothetical protein